MVVHDDTGAMVNIDYSCPYCHIATGEFISKGAGNVEKIDSDWETDPICGICDKEVLIENRKNNPSLV